MGPGSSGDYLNKLSANNSERDAYNKSTDENLRKSPIANVQSAFNSAASSVSNEVGKRTSEITSGFTSVAERGSSDFQSLASSAVTSVEKVTKKGTRDVKRTTLRAQKVMKRSTDGLVATSRGLSDIHFFEVVSFSPKIQAEEIVKWIDSQAKSGTQMVGSTAKTLVLNFTGKNDYQFGDVTKELVHRVKSHDVTMQDAILLLKILLALGTTIGPLAELLPFTFLVEALNISLEQKVGGKILEVLTKTLDNRLVAAMFTSDDTNLMGDVVKRTVLGGVLAFTGKSKYESGDIQRAVQQGERENNSQDMTLDLDIDSEFEEWDRQFVEKVETEDYVGSQAKIMDMKIAMALEECEAIAKQKGLA
eukprot:CAMPEP_0172308270 /NCGR_PEP_ID=MMETSP1058-20130122/8922_1 /TAXON_ID=83371 /ORGANISM="Detonula confervacea, Strain CCMP 353" /LENGTH=362 /DNA_ID=CAMNT_0013020649 /DNA_START=276 /DNA_END=1364 /DNA_ORIENTATION=+